MGREAQRKREREEVSYYIAEFLVSYYISQKRLFNSNFFSIIINNERDNLARFKKKIKLLLAKKPKLYIIREIIEL